MVVSDSAANDIPAADIVRVRRLQQLAGGGDRLLGNGSPLHNGDGLPDSRNSLACLTPNLMLIDRDLVGGFRRTGLATCDQTATPSAHAHPHNMKLGVHDSAYTI